MTEGKAATNVVFVGVKPVMNYVTAVLTQFGSSGEVIIKARGRAISRAVDAAEVARRRFLSGVKTKEIRIGTEEVTNKEGGKSNVSTIEITLTKVVTGLATSKRAFQRTKLFLNPRARLFLWLPNNTC